MLLHDFIMESRAHAAMNSCDLVTDYVQHRTPPRLRNVKNEMDIWVPHPGKNAITQKSKQERRKVPQLPIFHDVKRRQIEKIKNKNKNRVFSYRA